MRTKDYPWDLPSKKYHQSDQGVNTSLQPPFFVSLNVLPEPVNYAAISILTLGYGLSSLVGMRLGRHYICYNQSKTLDVLLKMPESFSSGPAENILIPVISGICMSMLFLFM
jgi:dolichol kinase